MDAEFEAFRQNYVHVHHQWVEQLCGEGRFAEAIEILSQAAAEMPDRDYFRKAQAEVRQRWAKARSPRRRSSTGHPDGRYAMPTLVVDVFSVSPCPRQ